MKEIAIVDWQDAGFPPEGLELAAIHWQRGYTGDVRYSKIEMGVLPTPPGYWWSAERWEKTHAAMYPPIKGKIDTSRFQRQVEREHRNRVADALRWIKCNPEIVAEIEGD